MRQRTGNVFGSEKNRGADHPADQQQHGVKQTKSAHQRGLRAGKLIFGGRRDGRGNGKLHHPIPSSSEDSSAVPQRRQMTEEQSPQVSGSVTSSAQLGQ